MSEESQLRGIKNIFLVLLVPVAAWGVLNLFLQWADLKQCPTVNIDSEFKREIAAVQAEHFANWSERMGAYKLDDNALKEDTGMTMIETLVMLKEEVRKLRLENEKLNLEVAELHHLVLQVSKNEVMNFRLSR